MSDLMPADRAAQTMPALLILTDRRQARGGLLDVVRAAVDGGARAFVVREKDLPRAQRVELAARLDEVVGPAGGILIGADDDLALCAGVHLSAAAPSPPTGGRPAIVGRSCHDRVELGAAAAAGTDYATLSPIFASRSKPGYGPALGIDALSRHVAAGLPLYALGGIDGPGRAAQCMAAGAAGVAVMGAVMRATEPRRLVRELVAAVERVPA